MRNALVRSFRDRLRNRLLAVLGVLALGVLAPGVPALGPAAVAAPPAPTDLVATDRPWDGGGVVDLTWTAPVVDGLEGFQVWRSPTGGAAAGKRSVRSVKRAPPSLGRGRKRGCALLQGPPWAFWHLAAQPLDEPLGTRASSSRRLNRSSTSASTSALSL